MSEDDFLGFFRSEEGLHLAAGQVLFAKGDTAREAFVVRSGELQIVDGNHVFETIGPGGIVGEMALIDRGQRSATVRAVDGAVVYEVSSEQYAPILSEHPELVDVLTTLMVKRLADRQERLDALDAERERRALARRIRNALLPA